MRTVLNMLSEERIGREVVVDWIKSEVLELGLAKSEALKSGATRRHLPN